MCNFPLISDATGTFPLIPSPWISVVIIGSASDYNWQRAEHKAYPGNHGIYFNPRTAGGLSHLRTAGGRRMPPPPRELEN